MKITLDLGTNEIIVPKNFFKDIDKQNEMIEKVGGTRISGLLNPIQLEADTNEFFCKINIAS